MGVLFKSRLRVSVDLGSRSPRRSLEGRTSLKHRLAAQAEAVHYTGGVLAITVQPQPLGNPRRLLFSPAFPRP